MKDFFDPNDFVHPIKKDLEVIKYRGGGGTESIYDDQEISLAQNRISHTDKFGLATNEYKVATIESYNTFTRENNSTVLESNNYRLPR